LFLFYTAAFSIWQDIFSHKLIYPNTSKYDHLRGRANPFFQNMSLDEVQTILFASTIAHVIEHADIYDGVVLYEDMVSRPR